jgi:hypothetical protein
MKSKYFLLAAVFLLAFAALFLVEAPAPAYASGGDEPIPPQPGGLPSLFQGWSGFFVAVALLWVLTSGLLAIRDCIVTKKEHGSGVGSLIMKPDQKEKENA